MLLIENSKRLLAVRIMVINLDTAVDRLSFVAQQLAGYEFERVRAVNGRTNPPKDWSKGRLSPLERALVESHRQCWRDLLDSEDTAACILEDDVFISKDFIAFMRNIDWIPKDADTVKLESFEQRCWLGDPLTNFNKRSVMRLNSGTLGIAAYIITRRGAEYLLTTETSSKPLDFFMFNGAILAHRKIYQITPALCQQGQVMANRRPVPDFLLSQLDRHKAPRKKILNILLREFMRPWFQLIGILNYSLTRFRFGIFKRGKRVLVSFK